MFSFFKKISLCRYRKSQVLVPVILLVFILGVVSSCQKRNEELSFKQDNLKKTVISGEESSIDLSTIEGVMNALYGSITFPEGSEPQFSQFSNLFSADASFIRITQDTVLKMNREIFIATFRKRIESAQLTSFFESEIKRQTMKWGSIAQVFSSYKKAFNSDQPPEYIRGINSLQLFHDGKRWWITSIIWEEETATRSLPQELS